MAQTRLPDGGQTWADNFNRLIRTGSTTKTQQFD